MEQLGIHCEHKTPETDMPILISSKYSSNVLISIPHHRYYPILNLFHLDYFNSLLFGLSASSLAQCRQKQAGVRYYETRDRSGTLAIWCTWEREARQKQSNYAYLFWGTEWSGTNLGTNILEHQALHKKDRGLFKNVKYKRSLHMPTWAFSSIVYILGIRLGF